MNEQILTVADIEITDGGTRLALADGERDLERHACRPRIAATCCRCSSLYDLCRATRDEIDEMLAGAWICFACWEQEREVAP